MHITARSEALCDDHEAAASIFSTRQELFWMQSVQTLELQQQHIMILPAMYGIEPHMLIV